MLAGLRYRLPSPADRTLNRLIAWLGIILVVSAGSFAAYYYWDRSGVVSEATPIERQIAELEDVVRANPEDKGARLTLAELYYAGMRYSDAASQYEAVLSLDESDSYAIWGLGRSLAAAGDVTGAEANFRKVIQVAEGADIRGDIVEGSHFFLGRIYLERGQSEEAIAELKAAVDIERSDADAWQLLGTAYVAHGDLEDAIAALTQAVTFVPDFAEAYEQLVIAYERQGAQAEKRYAQAMLAYSGGDFAKAASQLEAAIHGSPGLVNAHVGLGLVREAQGKRELALAAYQQALRLDPNSFNARGGLARLSGSTSAPSDAAHEVKP